MTLAEDIKHKATELGFDLVGITDASPINAEHSKLLSDWLNAGRAGQMKYMHRNFDKRINPAKLLQNAQSVICTALNYTPPKTKPPSTTAPTGRIANYAQYENYHPFIKKQLRKLTGLISAITAGDFEFKICVDSAPLAERALAARTGLGFIGKNCMLINPQLGCQLLLGEIITTLKLKTDKPITADCSGCNKCINACPTGALSTNHQFDTNRCISYLTIEYKGKIPADLADKIGDRLFGCDECILACPYQKNAPVCKNKELKFYSDRTMLNLQNVLNMTEDDFVAGLADSPIKRTGLEKLKANAEICLANTINPNSK